MFFEACCAGETFGGVNDLREAVLACVNACPDLASTAHIFRDRHDGGNMRITPTRQRASDEARELCGDPACQCELGCDDFSRIDDRRAARDAFGEAMTD